MNALHPAFVIAPLATALFAAVTIANSARVSAPPRKYASLDGLRGFLSLGVFFGHAALWYFYARSDQWSAPPSMYGNFAQYGVALFFMLTGFLFTEKLICNKKSKIHWVKLYTGRVKRLFPAYGVAVSIVLIIALASTGFEIRDPLWRLALSAIRWYTFTIAGSPDFNAHPSTWIIIAGVTWSLVYEWLFYVFLPIGALLVGQRPGILVVIFSIAGCLFIINVMPFFKPIFLMVFGSGCICAFLVRVRFLKEALVKPVFSVLAVGCLVLAPIASPGLLSPLSTLLAATSFLTIACGNSLLGLLTSPSARILGDISYSLYLYHGILLYIIFEFIEPVSNPVFYWGIISILTPFLIYVCHLSYRFVEIPAMNLSASTKIEGFYEKIFRKFKNPT